MRLAGSAVFTPGTTTQNVAVDVTGDTTPEADETFNLNLSSPINATIADNLFFCTDPGACAVGGNGIRSMGHAVRMLGREALYRWLSLLLVPGADGQSGVQAELVSATLLRARFCEVLGEAGRRPLAGGTLFLIGLLSSLETFYRMDLEATVGQLDLAPEITGALIGRRGPFGAALALAAAYEQGQWDEVSERCEELGIEDADLTNLYLDALTWAHERAQAMETDAAAA